MLESPDYPSFSFAFHDRAEIPGRVVKKVLCDDVELTREEALAIIHKRREQWPKR